MSKELLTVHIRGSDVTHIVEVSNAYVPNHPDEYDIHRILDPISSRVPLHRLITAIWRMFRPLPVNNGMEVTVNEWFYLQLRDDARMAGRKRSHIEWGIPYSTIWDEWHSLRIEMPRVAGGTLSL